MNYKNEIKMNTFFKDLKVVELATVLSGPAVREFIIIFKVLRHFLNFSTPSVSKIFYCFKY